MSSTSDHAGEKSAAGSAETLTNGTADSPDSTMRSDDYVLTRSIDASARLNLSHYIWHDSFGYSLHPTILNAIRGRENLRVADVGTGTGIWLLDVARILPRSTQLDAIDTSLNQFPVSVWLPPRVGTKVQDIFRDPPEHLHCYYDVIHIRHFVCVVKSNNPAPLLSNLIKMLKPGGFLQWGEWDVGRRQLIQAYPGAPREMIDKLEQEFKVMRKHTPNPTWPPRLDEHFLDAELEDVTMEKRLSPLSHLPYMHDLTMLVFKELIDQADASRSLEPQQITHLRKLLDGAIKESREGAAWNLTRCMAIGRKQDRS